MQTLPPINIFHKILYDLGFEITSRDIIWTFKKHLLEMVMNRATGEITVKLGNQDGTIEIGRLNLGETPPLQFVKEIDLLLQKNGITFHWN